MKTVEVISDLGITYNAVLIDSNFKPDKEHLIFYRNCSGINKYALIYCPKYDSLIVKKWGYDVFSIKKNKV